MVALLAVLVGALIFVFSMGTPKIFGGGTPKSDPATHQTGDTPTIQAPALDALASAPSSQTHRPATPEAVSTAPAPMGVKPLNKVSAPSWLTLFQSAEAVYLTNIYQHGKKLNYSLVLDTKKGLVFISQTGLRDLGLRLTFIDRCLARLISAEAGLYDAMISCPPHDWGEPKGNGFEVPPITNPFSAPTQPNPVSG